MSRRRSTARPTARAVALRGLIEIERGRSQRLRDSVNMRGLSARDRGFAWELAQGTERQHLSLDFVLRQFVTKKLPTDPLVMTALRLGAYQLLYLTRTPARAAINETVELLDKNKGFVNAVLRKIASRIENVPTSDEAAHPVGCLPLPTGEDGPRGLMFEAGVMPEIGSAAFLALQHGLPLFLVERWAAAFGPESCAEVCAASSTTPGVVLRSTPHLGDRSLAAELAESGVKLSEWAAHGDAGRSLWRVLEGDPFKSKAFEQGLFVAQHPTAYAAACALDVQSGETVLDLCAAPGTKTMVLAESVGASGRVFAYDVDSARCQRIVENAARLRPAGPISILDETGLADLRPVDRVLVDVPCSNTGVLARRAEVRRRLKPQTFAELALIQQQILKQGIRLCRPGGVVLYSTCSVDSEENRRVVDAVLSSTDGAGVAVVSDRLTLPDRDGVDGGYWAMLARGASESAANER